MEKSVKFNNYVVELNIDGDTICLVPTIIYSTPIKFKTDFDRELLKKFLKEAKGSYLLQKIVTTSIHWCQLMQYTKFKSRTSIKKFAEKTFTIASNSNQIDTLLLRYCALLVSDVWIYGDELHDWFFKRHK